MCKVEDTFTCVNIDFETSVCTAICRDGKKAGAEECDDGNTVINDGCEPDCTITPGWFCSNLNTISPSVCNYGCDLNTCELF